MKLNRERLKSKLTLFAVMFALQAGNAHAVPFTWMDQFDPADIIVNSQLNFTHDIRDGSDGFRVGLDTIIGVMIAVILADDALFGDLPSLGDGEEQVSFNFDGTGFTSPKNVGLLDVFDFELNTLLNDGVLSVSIRATQGDFKFLLSDLQVVGERATTAPVPATLGLLGLGLAGLGWSRRKA